MIMKWFYFDDESVKEVIKKIKKLIISINKLIINNINN